jgi:hypothetical protein
MQLDSTTTTTTTTTTTRATTRAAATTTMGDHDFEDDDSTFAHYHDGSTTTTRATTTTTTTMGDNDFEDDDSTSARYDDGLTESQQRDFLQYRSQITAIAEPFTNIFKQIEGHGSGLMDRYHQEQSHLHSTFTNNKDNDASRRLQYLHDQSTLTIKFSSLMDDLMQFRAQQLDSIDQLDENTDKNPVVMSIHSKFYEYQSKLPLYRPTRPTQPPSLPQPNTIANIYSLLSTHGSDEDIDTEIRHKPIVYNPNELDFDDNYNGYDPNFSTKSSFITINQTTKALACVHGITIATLLASNLHKFELEYQAITDNSTLSTRAKSAEYNTLLKLWQKRFMKIKNVLNPRLHDFDVKSPLPQEIVDKFDGVMLITFVSHANQKLPSRMVIYDEIKKAIHEVNSNLQSKSLQPFPIDFFVLWTPPKHSVFQPIELLWSMVKGSITPGQNFQNPNALGYVSTIVDLISKCGYKMGNCWLHCLRLLELQRLRDIWSTRALTLTTTVQQLQPQQLQPQQQQLKQLVDLFRSFDVKPQYADGDLIDYTVTGWWPWSLNSDIKSCLEHEEEQKMRQQLQQQIAPFPLLLPLTPNKQIEQSRVNYQHQQQLQEQKNVELEIQQEQKAKFFQDEAKNANDFTQIVPFGVAIYLSTPLFYRFIFGFNSS